MKLPPVRKDPDNPPPLDVVGTIGNETLEDEDRLYIDGISTRWPGTDVK